MLFMAANQTFEAPARLSSPTQPDHPRVWHWPLCRPIVPLYAPCPIVPQYEQSAEKLNERPGLSSHNTLDNADMVDKDCADKRDNRQTGRTTGRQEDDRQTRKIAGGENTGTRAVGLEILRTLRPARG
jgi:hypothetical protein